MDVMNWNVGKGWEKIRDKRRYQRILYSGFFFFGRYICTNKSQLHDFEKKHECKFTCVDMYILKQEKERIKVYFYFHNRVCILPQREASIIKNESIFK